MCHVFGYPVFRCPVCVFVPLTIRVIGHHAFAKIVQPRFFYLNRAIYTRKNKTHLK